MGIWRNSRFVRILCALYCTALGPVFSQPVLLPVSISRDSDEMLQEIILRSAGYAASVSGFAVPGSLKLKPADADSQEYADLARTEGADYVLVLDNKQYSDQVQLQMRLFSYPAGEFSSSEFSVPIDLNLDSHIGEAVEAFVRTVPLPAASAGGKVPQKSVPPASAPASSPILLPAAEPGSVPGGGQRVFFGLQGAPMLIVGGLNDLFRYGVDLSGYGGYALGDGNYRASIGIRAGAGRLFPSADALDGTVYLLRGALEAAVETAPEAVASLGLRVCGGPALVAAEVSTEIGMMTEIVPFAESAVSARLRLTGRIRLGTEIALLAVFEGDQALLSLSPALSIRFSP